MECDQTDGVRRSKYLYVEAVMGDDKGHLVPTQVQQLHYAASVLSSTLDSVKVKVSLHFEIMLTLCRRKQSPNVLQPTAGLLRPPHAPYRLPYARGVLHFLTLVA